MNQIKDGYLSVKQAAELLMVDEETIYRWLNNGTLSGAKIGGTWRIKQSTIDSFFER